MMQNWWASARCAAVTAWLLTTTQLTQAYTLDLDSTESLTSVASSIAGDLMSFYNGAQLGGVPGLLPEPYYWWEAGALMGALIDYWYYTGDTTYNGLTEQGLLFQAGPNADYMPPNQTLTEGNDDQGFWGMAVMTAAEYNFQDPPPDQPQWLALAQAVFNTQAPRWDPDHCGGGLRWQIFTWNNGFDYKNSISQACFFNLAARLARYTGNQSYANWAERTWDWMIASQFMDPSTYYVYDGAHIENCSDITPYQWTYNAGAFLLGAAAMYNFTNGSTQATWRTRIEGLLNGTDVFFTGPDSNIMTEVACESVNLCDLDQQSFKAYLSRWMAATTKWAPWSYDRIMPLLRSSAAAAAAQCTGGSNGRMCGLKWNNNGTWDGTTGVGQQMAAMEVILANLIKNTTPPVTNATGGTSQGNPSAGGSDVGLNNPSQYAPLPVTTADFAGAYILTVIVLLSLLGGILFVLWDERGVKMPSERLSDVRSDLRSAVAAASIGAPRLLRKRRRGLGASDFDARNKGKAIGMSHSGRETDLLEKGWGVSVLERQHPADSVVSDEFYTPPLPPLDKRQPPPSHKHYQDQRHRSTHSESDVGTPSFPSGVDGASRGGGDALNVTDMPSRSTARGYRLSYPSVVVNARSGGSSDCDSSSASEHRKRQSLRGKAPSRHDATQA